jgi:hypothetical protein
MPKKGSKRRSKADIYREKYNLIQKINKRVRDTVNRIGTMNETVQIFETNLTLSGRASVKAYDAEGKMYHLLSRSKEDIERMTLKDLRLLEKQTPTWSQTKSEIVREMNRDRKPGEQYTRENPPTMEEIKNQASITKRVHQMFEDNADLFYMLIDVTGWDDIKEHTSLEIYQEAKRINDFVEAGGVFDWSAPPEEVGENYIKRREESQERRNAALQRAYFEE